jgi:hypothetical protein
MGTLPAFAQTYYAEPAYRGEPIYVPGVRPGGPIHGGFVAPGDDKLLGDTIAALSAERDLNNINLTIVANNGELIVNGIAKDYAQQARMERIMKRVASGHATFQWTSQLG